jgi:hypothetical protein
MKVQILSGLMLLSFQSQAATLLWDCPSSADPDYTNVSIYKDGGKYFAEIEQEYGDGDGREEDLIEVTPLNSGSANSVFYAQVPGSRPSNRAIVRNPTYKTKGAVIHISLVKESVVAGYSAPNGDDLMDENLDCQKR